MRQKRKIGQLISTIVFFVAAILLIAEGLDVYREGEILKAILIWTGATMSLLGSFRFLIQNGLRGGRMSNKNNCITCQHHFITYDPDKPWGCRRFGFKSNVSKI